MVDKPDTARSLQDTFEAIDALFREHGPLAGIKDGYAPRPEQIEIVSRTL